MIDLRELFKDIESYIGKEITVKGWIRRHRKQKEFGFIDFSDGTCFKHMQVVYDKETKDFEKIDALTSTHEMYLIGAMNEWTTSDAAWALKASEDKKLWTGYITVTPDMYVDYGQADKNTTAIKVYNGVDCLIFILATFSVCNIF